MPILISHVPPPGTCIKIITINLLQHETETIGTLDRRPYTNGFVLQDGTGTWVFWKDNYPDAKPCYWVDLNKKIDDDESHRKERMMHTSFRLDRIEKLEILKK